MSNTLETIANHMSFKIQCLNKIISALQACDVPYIARASASIADKIMDYKLGSIDTLSTYFSGSGIQKHKKTQDNQCHFDAYDRFLRENNFIAFFDDYINQLKRARHRFPPAVWQEIEHEIHRYLDTDIKCRAHELVQDERLCPDCGAKLTFVQNTNELMCEACGLAKDFPWCSCDDEMYTVDTRKKTKRGSYDPAGRCDFWLERIQACESVEIDPSVIEKVRNYCKIDNIRPHKLTCAQIRDYLHLLKLTQYNNNVPHIKKLVTGIAPPQLTETELQLVRSYFDKVDRIFEEVKPPEKTNCPYYPFFIFKILEQILSGAHNMKRKTELLSCIHLQSRDTLIANDMLWESICAHIPEFVYIPTDRNNQLLEC